MQLHCNEIGELLTVMVSSSLNSFSYKFLALAATVPINSLLIIGYINNVAHYTKFNLTPSDC